MRHFARADGLHLWNYAEAQHPPDLMFGDVAQTLGQQGSVPAPITRPLGGSSSAARTGRSCSAGLPLRGASARADRPSRAKRPRHLLTVAGPTPNRRRHRRVAPWPAPGSPLPQRYAPLGLAGRPPIPQGRPFLACQHHFRRLHRGRLPYPLIYETRYYA